jgi:hypothetical protein
MRRELGVTGERPAVTDFLGRISASSRHLQVEVLPSRQTDQIRMTIKMI